MYSRRKAAISANVQVPIPYRVSCRLDYFSARKSCISLDVSLSTLGEPWTTGGCEMDLKGRFLFSF